MNTNNIKKYAPQARREFIDAVGKRLNQFGIYADSKSKSLTITEPSFSGSVMQIDGNSFDAGLLSARKRLVIRAEQMGFDLLVEQVAYTWFNRLCAIRFMELKPGYLEHGLRVLSHPEKAKGFEILDHAQDVAEQLGLDRDHIIELKLAGNKDEELYRHLLLGQCHQLHKAMPFLFEALDDETELLLPDNLTRTDSILRGLVDGIPEEDWQQVEIIGWLYQFYISEKKDQVIGKVVKSEDIPAATQLFTPNWIVKYLVQNSVGRQWLMTYPDSSLKAQMAYYIEPAEQDATVGAALAAITPGSIEPETLKILDPACGSGHILVEAYDILKAMYLERGYRLRDIPKLILENNLFGLDIDDRAAQLAGFALMMKAREDDRRIFARDIKLNVFAIQSTQGLNLPELWRKLALNSDTKRGTTDSIFDDAQTHLADALDNVEFNTLQSILVLFEQAKTFGSLIQVPADKAEFLHDLKGQLETLTEQGDSFQKPAAAALVLFVQQAWLLAQRYDVVVANPPYMGGKGMNIELKAFAQKHFPDSKSDLFAMFMERAFDLLKDNGYNAQVNMQSWMFLSSYQAMREKLLDTHTFITMAHLGARAFGQISGEVVQTTAFVLAKNHIPLYQPTFFRLIEGNEEVKRLALLNKENAYHKTQQDDFKKIPGSPIAYWVKGIHLFKGKKIGDVFVSGGRNKTHDNQKYLRFFWEVSKNNYDWVSYANGGDFRKYAGNELQVVNWSVDARNYYDTNGGLCNEKFWGKEGITWSLITSSVNSFRIKPDYSYYSSGSPTIFNSSFKCDNKVLAFLNSPIGSYYLKAINPTINTTVGDIFTLPFNSEQIPNAVDVNVKNCISISKTDWDSYETSWNFPNNPLIKCVGRVSDSVTRHVNTDECRVTATPNPTYDYNALVTQQIEAADVGLRDEAANPTYASPSLEQCFNQWQTQNREAIAEMQRLEEENNRLFIEAYGLQDELSPEVPEAQITLTRADREKDCQRLISYAIGCMMGRYRLDKPGLIYAHAGNVDFEAIYNGVGADLSAHGRMNSPPHFAPDDDGISIVPTLQRGNAVVDAPASRNAGALQAEFPRQSVGTINADPLPQQIEVADVGLRDKAANPTYMPTANPFPPDDDGIIPLTDQEWFKVDATNQFREFVRTVWGEDTVQQNLDFVAESLCLTTLKPKKSESSLETIRRYLSSQFYKDHRQTYKKRPIYWLFSSGKQKAFECLVYLHRYNESTLSRMRTEYVTPLLGKYDAFANQLNKQIEDATPSEATLLKNKLIALEKKRAELREFDDKLKHYADMRIKLDLDDGVKVNYGKFGDLLAEVKAITGDK